MATAMKVPVRDEGAGRASPDAADAVAAGAAGPHPRAEPDQQARKRQHRVGGVDRHGRQASSQAGVGQRSEDQAGQEGDPPAALARGRGEQAAEDAADARDAPVEE